MEFFLLSLAVLSLSGFLILFLGRFEKLCHALFVFSIAVAAGFVLVASFPYLCRNFSSNFKIPWPSSFGEFSVGLDPLSAFFLMTIACVALASGIYGSGYLRGHGEKRNLAAHYFFYLQLTTCLLLVVTAKNALVFLAAWELMTIFAYFLITFYDEKKSVRQAGFLYLVVTHCGTFCLLVMFILMGHAAGSMDFDQMALTHYSPAVAAVLFGLGLIGFGVKAGFFPAHIWLPHAHPAAPSYISAMLSGFMIKTGIYGLLRLIFMMKDVPPWGGPAVLLIGAVSGVLGVLYALGQHEIKKLLAYHSIENIGIIALGIGIGLVGSAAHQQAIAVIGYAGALLHVFNHAIFKSLLFLSAGSVIRSTGTGEIDEMGGLLKHLPFTGHLFLIGSLSICGLPLFNGFISEWLVYKALFDGVIHFNKGGIILSALSLVSLALIGGLALACFAKAFSVIFLGKNRSRWPVVYRENSWRMWAPMMGLAAICVWIGLFPKTMVTFSLGGAYFLTSVSNAPAGIETLVQPMLSIIKVLYVFLLIASVLFLFRKFLSLRVSERQSETWACGYASPSPRMQYTASSFAEPLLRFFKSWVFFKVHSLRPSKYFPTELELSSKVTDGPEHYFFRPAYTALRKFSKMSLKLQSGHIPQYLFYILLAVVALLLWKFPWSS